MKDGSYVTGLFLLLIVLMVYYAGANFLQHKQALEIRVLDQQTLIEQQEQTILKLNNTNVMLQNYMMMQESKKKESIFY